MARTKAQIFATNRNYAKMTYVGMLTRAKSSNKYLSMKEKEQNNQLIRTLENILSNWEDNYVYAQNENL